MPSLNCGIFSKKILNPFIIGASPASSSPENIARAFDKGWGGAVYDPSLKTVSFKLTAHNYEEKNALGIITSARKRNKISVLDIEEISPLKKNYKDRFIALSLFLYPDTDCIDDLFSAINRILPDAVEINLSPLYGYSIYNGDFLKSIRKTLLNLKKKLKVPVIAKLNYDFYDAAFKTAFESGADAVTLLNSLPCLPEININENNYNDFTSAFYSGYFMKIPALRAVYDAARSGFDKTIFAAGGAYDWRTVVEYILSGAAAVQVSAAVLKYGYDIVEEYKEGVLDWMDSRDFKTINDFKGLLLKAPDFSKDKKQKLKARIDKDACVRCSVCFFSCLTIAAAIGIDGDNYPYVKNDKCRACGLCVSLCPQKCVELDPL